MSLPVIFTAQLRLHNAAGQKQMMYIDIIGLQILENTF